MAPRDVKDDFAKAEQAMRQAFDLFQLGASMLSNQEGQSKTKTETKTKKPIKTKVITFDSEDDSEREDKLEEDLNEEFQIIADDDYFVNYSKEYIDFTAQNPTTFHVVEYFSKLLESKGFEYLSEKEDWDLSEGLYYTTRNSTNLAAFAIGKDWKPEYGAGIIGSHIDSLATKLKPVSSKAKVDGYELLGVVPYAGALSPLWFDRDLGLGGRVLIKKQTSSGTKFVSKLINSSPKPIARVSTLAPHFGSVANPPYDLENQAVPVIGFNPGPDPEPTESEKKSPLYGKHPLDLLRYIAELAETKVENLVTLDLDLFDVQKGTIGGLKDDFIYAPRIDDRICSYAAISALLEFTEKPIPSKAFAQVLLYDNEEIGSLTRQGAKSTLVSSITERAIASFSPDKPLETLARVSFANSIILSADVTHLLNPNYKSAYLDKHFAVPNTGITIALDPNGHMATDAVGLALSEELAKINGDTLQYFHIKNGERSGGTIGPSIASATGARTIDLGIPQLSMHSIRAATGIKDLGLGVKFFRGFFQNWRSTLDGFGDL